MSARVPNASTFLAVRYLRPKRSFVSVITVVSLLGVAVGVLMMIVVKSVMLGFDADFRKTLLGSEPHLILEGSVADQPAPADWQAVKAGIERHPNAAATAVFAGGMLYASRGEGQAGFPVFGVNREEAAAVLAKVSQHLEQGDLSLAEDTLVLSDFAANRLGVRVGDEITVYDSHAVNRAARSFKEAMNEADAARRRAMHERIGLDSRQVTVAGIYRGETGGFYGYASLATGRRLFGLQENDVSGLLMELREPYEARETGTALAPSPAWKTRTWLDEGEARLAAMRNEQILMTIVLWIIAVVAAFSVMNTTITVTVQKRREIGMLTALGCRTADIVRVFVTQAAVVGGVGVAMGVGLSLLVLGFRNEIREALARLTASQVHAIEGVFLAEIPSQLTWTTVALAAGGSFVMCLVAACLPAWFAARLEPAVALRD